jgi:Pyridoxamine 5'-phosphate oxidase
MTAPRRWSDFEAEAPEIAAAGRELLYQHGPGLGYLATLRDDGAPRVHPVCPVVAEGGLYVFIGNQSPKVRDLGRDGRYSLHTFPCPDVDDEFFLSGTAVNAEATGVRDGVYAAYIATGATTSNDTLFELLIDRALHAQYGPRPSWPPDYRRWSPS